MSNDLEERIKRNLDLLADRNIYIEVGGSMFRIDYEAFERMFYSDEYKSIVGDFDKRLKDLIKSRGGVEEKLPPGHRLSRGFGYIHIYEKFKSSA